MVDAEVGYATQIARQYGFTPDHFNRLLDSYRRSWGGDLRVWGQPRPPLSPPPAAPVYPGPPSRIWRNSSVRRKPVWNWWTP